MKFTFNYDTFQKYYANISNFQLRSPIKFDVFRKTSNVNKSYVWSRRTVTSVYSHIYLPNLYITFNDTYAFFNILSQHSDGILYGNHFSIGLKPEVNVFTKRPIVDIHFTEQVPATQESVNPTQECVIILSYGYFSDSIYTDSRRRTIHQNNC